MKFKLYLIILLVLPTSIASAQWQPTNTSASDNATIYHLGGNVGIGTSTPGFPLEVKINQANANATVSANFPLSLVNTSLTTNSMVGFQFKPTVGATAASGVMGYQFTNTATNYGRFFFSTRGSDGALERMTITENGKIGIGTPTPVNNLDVLSYFTPSETSMFVGQDHNFSAATGRYGIGFSFSHVDGTATGKKAYLNTWFANTQRRAMTFDNAGNIAVEGTLSVNNGSLRLNNAAFFAEISKVQTGPYANNTGLVFRTEYGAAGGTSQMIDALKITHNAKAIFIGSVGLSTDGTFTAEMEKYQSGPYVNNVGIIFRTERGGQGGTSDKIEAMKILHTGQAQFVNDVSLDGKLSFSNQSYSADIIEYQSGSNANNLGFIFKTERGGMGGTSDKIDALKIYHGGQAQFVNDISLDGKLSFTNQAFSADIIEYQSGPYANNTGMIFRTEAGGMGGTSVKVDALTLHHSGNIGIGTNVPDTKLTVKGVIHTNEVRVDVNSPIEVGDYVFDKNYNLLTLPEVESYINENKHLPEVPSANQMVDEGLNLKEMNLLLLKKVEELTLYLIEEKKEINQLKQENKKLTDRMTGLEKTIEK
jgi:hypothetical protein